MAVYKRLYQGYDGPLTPEWSRLLIIARYAYRNLFDSKLLITFFVVCFIAPVVAGIWIYLPHNAAVRELMNPEKFIPINNQFFFDLLRGQSVLAFLLTAFIGPGLISADLANNALPLYFCRAFTKTEYVAGKMAVLAILLSALTWVPLLALFFFHAALTGWTWISANWYIAWALFAGAWIWIFVLCLLALSVSAVVKRRVVAGGIILGIFFVPAGFGAALNESLETHMGDILNMGLVLRRIWNGLFGIAAESPLTVEAAWMAVAALIWFCLYLLNRKVRAYEVVK
ncbi:MAG TPA: hypothetical protein VN428_09045 [Bryobacteraceae bacterium]|nr:hypothetical protein [Bryobacteraceae bacterium]